MRRILSILLLLIPASGVFAQDKQPTPKLQLETRVEKYTDEFLDTVNVKKKLKLNDYSMIGIQYGTTLSRVMWNPSQKQETVFLPLNVGVTYSKYGKMFGYMPYFGIQIGLFYGQEGYKFKHNEHTNYTYKIQGAESAVIEMVEMPFLSHFHIDMWKMKIIAQLGMYVGYRLSIERFPGETGKVDESVAHSFMPTDNRFDYGIKGGVGFGLVFDPVEIHIQAMYKHSFSSLYEADHYSKYYYRFAYPSNIIISAGVHFHLSKRSGKSKAELKKLAKEIVYNNGNAESKGR